MTTLLHQETIKNLPQKTRVCSGHIFSCDCSLGGVMSAMMQKIVADCIASCVFAKKGFLFSLEVFFLAIHSHFKCLRALLQALACVL